MIESLTVCVAQDNRGADKLTEWSGRMDKLRLQDMKLQRQVTSSTPRKRTSVTMLCCTGGEARRANQIFGETEQ